jgi:predicted nucleic-acid-binding protein
VRAIDTNVVVRFLTGDDARQFRKARDAIKGGDIFISTSVLLESEWVLRSAYGFPPQRISDVLRALAGLPGVSIEEPAVLGHALDAFDSGMDFADALHLGAAKDCTAFLTFDRKLTKLAEQRSTLQVVEP